MNLAFSAALCSCFLAVLRRAWLSAGSTPGAWNPPGLKQCEADTVLQVALQGERLSALTRIVTLVVC